MKKLLVLGYLLMFAFMASAQQGGGGFPQMTPEQWTERMAPYYERMKTEINLTDKQLADIKKVGEEFFPKTAELFQKFEGDFEKIGPEMQKLREQQNEKVKTLISAEQYKKYVEFVSRPPGGGN